MTATARVRIPTRPVDLTSDDHLALGASAIASVSMNWLVFARLTDGVGWFAFTLCAFFGFLVVYFLVTTAQLGRLVATDRLATVVVHAGAFALLAPLGLLIGYIVYRGLPALRPGFFIRDQAGITPLMPATAGGGAHALVGTLQQAGLALVWALPLGVVCAVFLNETRSRWRRPVRLFVDAMSGLPSIVTGLFIFATLILPYAGTGSLFSYNGLMASLALSMIMLPTVTRTVTVVLSLVPGGLREASLALGASRARTVWSIVLPTARSGITTAVVLGLARVVGETAPLLFTAFGTDLMNLSPIGSPQESLPLFVYRNVLKPSDASIDRGFTGALVLLLLVLALFTIARAIGRERTGRTRPRPSLVPFRRKP